MGAHHRLSLALGLSDADWIRPGRRPFDRLLQDLKAELRATRGHAIISSETFYRLSKAQIETLAAQVDDRFDVRVVVYLRRQDRSVESEINHRLKTRNGARQEANPLRDDAGDLLDYKLHVDRWAEVFSHDSIVVRVYEKGQLPNGTIADFLDILGLGPNQRKWLRTLNKRENPSLTLVGMDFAERWTGRLPSRSARFLKALDEVMPEDRKILTRCGAPTFLSQPERKEINTRFARSNAELARTYLGRADGRLFFDIVEDTVTEHPPPKLTHSELANMAAQLWHAADRRQRRRSHMALAAGLVLLALLFGMGAGLGYFADP
jgi:hypothetical protein